MKSFFKNKSVLVTGACGTVGLELIRQLLVSFKVGELIGIDNNESELFFLEDKFADFNKIAIVKKTIVSSSVTVEIWTQC